MKMRTKPITVLKCVGPKLVPFFKAVAVFFVLFPEESRLASYFYCLIKCLPVISLIFFVLLHGMSLIKEEYSYSRRVLLGLIFSCAGDAFLVWKNEGYFLHGLVSFAVAQALYASAFGLRPAAWRDGGVVAAIAAVSYAYLYPGFKGVMVYFGALYVLLIGFMAWRAAARVRFFDDNWVWRDELWTWTKLCSCGGALFFMVSDLVIAVDRFRVAIPYSHQIIMVTYYIAQMGIALSVVDSQVDAVMARTARDAGKLVPNGCGSYQPYQNGKILNGTANGTASLSRQSSSNSLSDQSSESDTEPMASQIAVN